MDIATINRLANRISTSDWDEINELIIDNYQITQFQGTAFDSNYQCYKIAALNKSGKGFHPIAVAKITNRLEPIIMGLLLQKGFSVPRVVQTLTNGSEDVMIFEDYINGKELFECSTVFNWITTAKELGRIHSCFWNDTGIPSDYWSKLSEDIKQISNDIWMGKLNAAQNISNIYQEWRNAFAKIQERLQVCPKTLIHGDMFPTNVIINGRKPFFIDWANSGEFPYFRDVGRIIGVLNMDTNQSFCPKIKDFLENYYGAINTRLNICFDEFLIDVYIGQFIELANYYNPMHNLYANATRARYDERTKELLFELSHSIIEAQ